MPPMTPYQSLLMQMGMGGPTGFMSPGTGTPASGAPVLPQSGQRGASIGAPSMPSAFGANGTMNGQPGGGQGGGMFGQLASNPMALMAMLKGGAPNAAANSPVTNPTADNAGFSAEPLSSPGNTGMLQTLFANGGQNPFTQGFSGDGPQPGQSPGIMAFLQHMFGGGSGS